MRPTRTVTLEFLEVLDSYLHADFPFFAVCGVAVRKMALPEWAGRLPRKVKLHVTPNEDGKYKLFQTTGRPKQIQCGRKRDTPSEGLLSFLEGDCGLRVGERFSAEIEILRY